VVSVSDDQFEEEVLHNSGSVLVDFFTPWCPPCRQVAPVLEELCSENRPNLKIVKIDAVENPKTATEHRVSAVPTFVLFHAGKKVGQISGFQSKAQFVKWIASSVSGAA
jgi:thioredoxin 1